jgi:ribose 5-phosphate isomerase B
MKVYLAADHGGFELKNSLLEFVKDLGYELEDCGAFHFDMQDDYPVFIQKAARAVAEDPLSRRAIVIGGSGQGEAFAANKIKGIRAVVYYGEPARKQLDADGKEIDMITSTRDHNDSNVLSLGGRFITIDEAKMAIKKWLATPFSGAERHARRHRMLEETA